VKSKPVVHPGTLRWLKNERPPFAKKQVDSLFGAFAPTSRRLLALRANVPVAPTGRLIGSGPEKFSHDAPGFLLRGSTEAEFGCDMK